MIYAAVSTAITAALALAQTRRWRQRRQPHAGAWALGLWLGAAASLAYVLAAWTGGEAWFRLYYLCGAVLVAPVLGLGSVWLALGARAGRWAAAAVAALAVPAGWGVATAPLDAAALAALAGGSGRGVLHLQGAPLAAMIALNLMGTVAVAGVALASAWRAARRRAPAGLVVGNLLIALGVVLLGAAGGAARWGGDAAFWPTMALGWVVVYAGVRRASGAAGRARAAGEGAA